MGDEDIIARILYVARKVEVSNSTSHCPFILLSFFIRFAYQAFVYEKRQAALTIFHFQTRRWFILFARTEESAGRTRGFVIVTGLYRLRRFLSSSSSITDPRDVTGKVTLSCKRFYQPTLPASTMAGNCRLEKAFLAIAKIVPRLDRSAISWNNRVESFGSR